MSFYTERVFHGYQVDSRVPGHPVQFKYRFVTVEGITTQQDGAKGKKPLTNTPDGLPGEHIFLPHSGQEDVPDHLQLGVWVFLPKGTTREDLPHQLTRPEPLIPHYVIPRPRKMQKLENKSWTAGEFIAYKIHTNTH